MKLMMIILFETRISQAKRKVFYLQNRTHVPVSAAGTAYMMTFSWAGV
jgi:hypothetical protein